MTTNSIDPVIINISLAESELCRCLQKEYKVRFSESTLQNSCIFPLSTVTFMILKEEEFNANICTDETVDIPPNIIERLQQLQNGHQNCYLILSAALHEKHELSIMTAIQDSVLDSNMKILPSHNDNETAAIMAMIAKAKTKHTSAVLKQRLDTVAKRQIHEEMILRSLATIGILTDHECLVLQHGFGSLSNILNASKKEILENTCLASDKADKIINLFSAK